MNEFSHDLILKNSSKNSIFIQRKISCFKKSLKLQKSFFEKESPKNSPNRFLDTFTLCYIKKKIFYKQVEKKNKKSIRFILYKTIMIYIVMGVWLIVYRLLFKLSRTRNLRCMKSLVLSLLCKNKKNKKVVGRKTQLVGRGKKERSENFN